MSKSSVPMDQSTQACRTSNSPLHRRGNRWLRFSLRTMLVAFLMLSLALGWLGRELQQFRARALAIRTLQERGGMFEFAAVPEELRKQVLASSPKAFEPNDKLSRNEKSVNDSMLAARVRPAAKFVERVADSLGIDRPPPVANIRLATGFVMSQGCYVPDPSRVTDDDLKFVAYFPEATSFHLAAAAVTEEGLAPLRRLTKLECLRLNGKQFTNHALEFVPRAAPLKELSLGGTHITDEGIASLPAFPKLNQLGLDGTDISDATLAELARWPELYDVTLSRTKVSDAGMAHLARLPNLLAVRLAHTQVSDVGIRHLAQYKSINWLDLSGTQLSDEGLKHIAKMRHLQALELADTSVTSLGVEPLKELSELNLLFLRGTKVSPECIKSLKAALPNCEIDGG